MALLGRLDYAMEIYKIISFVSKAQAYINKGHIPIQVFPVSNVYTNSFVVWSCITCISI